MFQLNHHKVNSETVVEWRITNLTSQLVISRTETPREAMLRQGQGRTIANCVLKAALDGRALELERLLGESTDNPTRIANLQSKIRTLRPRRCLIGLGFFGLLHSNVQQNSALASSNSNDTSSPSQTRRQHLMD